MFKLIKKVLSPSYNVNVLRSSSKDPKSKKTCLYEFHLEQKAKMVDFAGFQMPVIYADQNISSSHIHTRNHVSIFDVSHMLQTVICGEQNEKFIESLVVSDIQGLEENHSVLTVFTNEKGGIIDDLIVTKTNAGQLYLVSNAGCIEKDLKHLQNNLDEFNKKMGTNVKLKMLKEQALIAVQGPGTSEVLKPVIECNMEELTFMTSIETTVCGIKKCRVTRCGYTGEDGVEISVPTCKARILVENLLTSTTDKVKLAGLAARDTLRLEAGLCLYGNDIDESRTPVEAGLSFTIGKRRREKANFPGSDVILKQLKEKPLIKRVGFVNKGPPARAQTRILNDGELVGLVTSGSPSPTLHKNISMGYVPLELAKKGTKLMFEIRNKLVEAEIVQLPFIKPKYFNKIK